MKNLKDSICKSNKPAAIFVLIVHDEGEEAIVAGVHQNAVSILRPLARRMAAEYQAINEKLQQDHPRLDAVPREVIDKVVGELVVANVMAETTKVH